MAGKSTRAMSLHWQRIEIVWVWEAVEAGLWTENRHNYSANLMLLGFLNTELAKGTSNKRRDWDFKKGHICPGLWYCANFDPQQLNDFNGIIRGKSVLINCRMYQLSHSSGVRVKYWILIDSKTQLFPCWVTRSVVKTLGHHCNTGNTSVLTLDASTYRSGWKQHQTTQLINTHSMTCIVLLIFWHQNLCRSLSTNIHGGSSTHWRSCCVGSAGAGNGAMADISGERLCPWLIDTCSGTVL